MRGKLNLFTRGILGVALLAMVMLLPMNLTKAEAEETFTNIDLMNISRPNDIDVATANGEGIMFTAADHTTTYYSFTIKERGWVFFLHSPYSYGFSTEALELYRDKNLDFSVSRRYGGSHSAVDKDYYYLDPGTYYIRYRVSTDSAGNCYGYFLGNSKILNCSSSKINCSTYKVDMKNMPDFQKVEIAIGTIAVDGILNDWGKKYGTITSDTNSVSVDKNGEYSIRAYNNTSAEWEPYPASFSFKITNLTDHSATYSRIKDKASFYNDGKIENRCSKCHAVTGTSVIRKISTVKLDKSSYTYTGSSIKPTVTLYDDDNKRISKSYYDVSYSNNKSIGKGYVIVKLKGSKYSGERKVGFSIVPKPVTVKSVTPARKSLTVKWAKASGVSGYEIQVSTSSSFSTSLTRTYNVSKSYTSKTIKSLKPGTKYYVRMRANKKVSGKTYNSKWCSYKKVTVK